MSASATLTMVLSRNVSDSTAHSVASATPRRRRAATSTAGAARLRRRALERERARRSWRRRPSRCRSRAPPCPSCSSARRCCRGRACTSPSPSSRRRDVDACSPSPRAASRAARRVDRPDERRELRRRSGAARPASRRGVEPSKNVSQLRWIVACVCSSPEPPPPQPAASAAIAAARRSAASGLRRVIARSLTRRPARARIGAARAPSEPRGTRSGAPARRYDQRPLAGLP